jgi:hypothetical protein
MSLFHQGLSPMLREHLTLFRGCTLNELVSTSIEQEDTCRTHIEEERKKRPLSRTTEGALPKYRLVYTPPSGQPRAPSISEVDPLSTSAGGPTSSSLPTVGCSTSCSVACWGGLPVLQLQAYWALHSRVSPALLGLLS